MEKRRYCTFNFRIPTTKAYIDDSTGLKHITAVASDTGIDWYRERFAEAAIDDMVYASRQTKKRKPSEGLVDLQVDHWATFAIGFATDGEKVADPSTGLKSYKVDFALKNGPWEGEELYSEIKNGEIDKQLSVGGYIPDWEKDYEVVSETFENDDGDEVEVQVGIIKRFVLEHVAVTPPDGAANPRTEFLTAKDKNINLYENGSVYKSANDANYQKRFETVPINEKNKTEGTEEDDNFIKGKFSELKSMFKEVVNEVFGEREDSMNKVEKAKKLVSEFKEMIEKNPEDFTEEVVKSLGVTFVEETEGETPESITEEHVQSVVKDKLDAVVEEWEKKLKAVEDSIPELPEAPVIPEDQSEKVKSLEEKIEDLEKRLKAVETEDPGSQNEHENTEDNDDDNEEDNTNEEDNLPPELRAWA